MKFISLLLAQVMFISSIAQAAGPVVNGLRYLNSCEGAMTAIGSGEMDSFLVNQVQNEQQALQLLNDYGLILSNAFREAISLALEDRGIKIPEPSVMKKNIGSPGETVTQAEILKDEKKKLKVVKSYLGDIMSVLQLNDREFQLFCLRVLELIQKVRLTGTPNTKAEVANLMLERVIAAIHKSEKNENFYASIRLVVRQTLETTARHLAWRQAQIRAEVWPARIALMGWITFGLMDISGTLSVSPESTQAWVGAGVISSLVSAVVTGVLVSIADFALPRSLRNKEAQAQAAFGESKAKYAFESLNSGQLEREIRDLFQVYEDKINKVRETDPILSLEQASKLESPEFLNPVQILYLGHLDILELEKMAETLSHKLNAVTTGANAQDIRARADHIVDGSTGFEEFASFMQSIFLFDTAFRSLKSEANNSSATLKNRIAKVKAVLPKVKTLVFDFGKQAPTSAQLKQSELLWTKLNSDLKSLQTMELDQDKLMADVKRLEPFVSRLETIFADVRNGSIEVEPLKIAEEVMLILDEMPQLGAAQ